MTILQSTRRTRGHELDHRTHEKVWPELCLNMTSAEQSMSGVALKINVAVVDSGVPNEHSGVPGQDRDDDGHATHLAATIHGPKKYSALHINIRPVKFFGAQGWPKPERGAQAIERAAELFPGVIVLAWDVGHATDELREAIFAVRKASVVVIAAGNWSLDNDKHPNWPANYGDMDHVITVMATDEHDERASFSSYGKRSVYIAAPGFVTLDAAPSSSKLREFGSLREGYSKFRGTSAASAHVARLAALVRAKNPTWSPSAVKEHIGNKARPVPALERFCVKGAIADFEAALK